ncbi:MAG: glutathione S-transferase family protein [Candidatus Binatia bacterium]
MSVNRTFGSELSPYSVKVRSYFRYKNIPHEWVPRSSANEEEFRKYAKLPLIPLVVTPQGEGLQDSTPILERFERLHPEPSIHPSDPTAAFVSTLIEEYGDEWGNKPMFHYRWSYGPDQDSAAGRIARQMAPGLDDASFAAIVEAVKGRMVPRLKLVGSSPETKDQIEGSLHRQLSILETHLAKRKYLFGGRPAFADFGLYPQLYQCSSDPTPGALLRERAPNTLAWIERMLSPRAEGPFEEWRALEPTLEPLLRDEVGAIFLPWSDANSRALAAGEKDVSLTLGGKPFGQEAQKYHAKSLAALRARYAAVTDKSALDPLHERTGCLRWLRAA